MDCLSLIMGGVSLSVGLCYGLLGICLSSLSTLELKVLGSTIMVCWRFVLFAEIGG